MRRSAATFSFLFCIFIAHGAAVADGPETGPVVAGFGPVFAVPDNSFNLERGRPYKIVMDIGAGPEDPAELNQRIESAARFLNLHARNGIEPGQLQLAVVLHGSAAKATLSDEAHVEYHGAPNANRAMLEALHTAGVDIYLCGQTAGYYGYPPEKLLPQVTMAVSAMTVHVRLQEEGYRAILF